VFGRAQGDKLWVIDAGPGTILQYQKKGKSLGSPVTFTTTYPAVGNFAQLAGIALK